MLTDNCPLTPITKIDDTPEPQNGNGFRSGPYPGMVPALTVEESIRLGLLVAAGRIPFPTSYREVTS